MYTSIYIYICVHISSVRQVVPPKEQHAFQAPKKWQAGVVCVASCLSMWLSCLLLYMYVYFMCSLSLSLPIYIYIYTHDSTCSISAGRASADPRRNWLGASFCPTLSGPGARREGRYYIV